MKFFANLLASQAMLNQSRKKDKKALALYKRAYEGGTNDSGALSAYSLLLLREGEFQGAAKMARAARECAKKPRHLLHARMNRGLALWKLGRIDDAINTYENIFGENKIGVVYGTLGFLYIAKGDQSGDYQRALQFNEEAFAYDADDAVVIDNLAQTHMRLDRWQEAEQGFRKALAAKPDQFDSLVCLARCLHKRGEIEEAREYIARALARPFSHLNTVDRAFAEELAREIEDAGSAGE